MESQKDNKKIKAKDLNELLKIYENKDILTNKEFIECVKLIVKFNTNKIIPNYKINEKIKKKFLEKMPFSKTFDFIKDDNDEEEDNKKQNIDKKTTIEYIKYPSGIIEKITKYTETRKVISKEIDYSELKQKYIDQLEKNIDEQLKLLIENIGFIYNSHSSIIRKIVKNPFSSKVFMDKLFLWNHYMDKLDDVGKSKILEKWLNQLKIFAEKCYEEFVNIKQVKKMYLILKERNKINDNEDIFLKYNKYYGYDEIFGIDARGNILDIGDNDKKLNEVFTDSLKLFLLKTNVIDIKTELEGNGVSFIFLEELKNFAEMFWYSSILYLRIFYDGLVLFKDCFFEKYIRIQSIMISFFSDAFLEKHFILSLLIYIKFIFGSYQEMEILTYMQKILTARIRVFGATDDLREGIEKLLKENDKLENIDELVKYIEGDDKTKKKKKKKKNKQGISLDDLKIGEKKENDDLLDDGISIMSEPDSIVESFKNEIINDTKTNNGEKIKLNLSKNFLDYLDN